MLIESWRRHYNAVRPHSSLGYQPPAPEVLVPASKLAPRRTLNKHNTRINHMRQASGTRQLSRTGSYNWVAAPMLVACPRSIPTANELDLVNYVVSTRRWQLLMFER